MICQIHQKTIGQIHLRTQNTTTFLGSTWYPPSKMDCCGPFRVVELVVWPEASLEVRRVGAMMGSYGHLLAAVTAVILQKDRKSTPTPI
jgi:hypothetical protein